MSTFKPAKPRLFNSARASASGLSSGAKEPTPAPVPELDTRIGAEALPAFPGGVFGSLSF